MELVIQDAEKKVTLEHERPGLMAISVACQEFLAVLHNAHRSVKISKLTADNGSYPKTLNYQIVLADGRRWKQTFRFFEMRDTDPVMTFDVTDGWKMSEFSLFRDVRDKIIAIQVQYGIKKLAVQYNEA